MTIPLPPKSMVLYADDDPDDLALLQDAFHAYTHVIDLLTFRDGIALLHFVEHLSSSDPSPCLIILDINMPRLNGIEVLKELRNKRELSGVPVVLFSTSTLPAEAAIARRFNAGFVTKPLVYTQIQQIVDELLAHCKEEIRQLFNRK